MLLDIFNEEKNGIHISLVMPECRLVGIAKQVTGITPGEQNHTAFLVLRLWHSVFSLGGHGSHPSSLLDYKPWQGTTVLGVSFWI